MIEAILGRTTWRRQKRMAPQKFASVRSKSRPTTLVPFRDDTNLIGLRYDQTVQAEPPIPIPPPRSPLRNRNNNTAVRPTSIATTTTVVVPPPRPPPPTEQHPALRTITSPRTNVNDPKRDSGHAPTTSSHSYTLHEESEYEDDDAFSYKKFDGIRDVSIITDVQRLSNDNLLENDRAARQILISTKINNNSSQSSIPLPSPGLSEDSNTVSPTSPTTPPPHFAERAASIFSKSFGLRSSRSSMKSMRSRKLKKKPEPHSVPLVGDDDDLTTLTPVTNETQHPISTPAGHSNVPQAENDAPLDEDSESPKLTSTAAAHVSGDFSDFIKDMEFSNRGSIMLGGKRPATSKKIFAMPGNDISEEPAVVQREVRFFPLVPSASASQSAIAQSNEATIEAHPTNDVIVEEDEAVEEAQEDGMDEAENTHESTAFELSSREMTISPPLAASTPAPVPVPIVTLRPTTPEAAPIPEDFPSPPRSPPQPPSIRFLPVDVERESQKVRSLYESGDGLNWEDGGRLSSFSSRLEPTEEVPSDCDENDAPSLEQNQSHGGQPPGDPRAATGTPVFAERTVSLRDDSARRAYELAGGLEDWEDVNGEDVDRFGFITIRRPETRSGTPVSLTDKSMHYSPRQHRNVLVRRDAHHSGYLTARRGPSRKMSARSLHTQASGMSTASRQTTRSAIRQASNLLPHNRERRWMDDAGDMLAIQPGLSSILEDHSAVKLAEDYKRKEWERAEKWQKMAKVINNGQNGEGMVFEFDTKSPKLIERTWKGIPDRWRSAAWFSFLATSARNSKEYNATEDELISDYHHLQYQPSPDDMQIDLDVPRTISQHIMFRRRYRGGQRLLFRVLHALSLYFPKTGYVQGMASLAATLLSYYDEEKCFIMLVRLWQLRGLNRLYQPGFAELMGALDDFEKLWLGDKDVAKKLQELCINPTAYGTRWYLTLFNLSIPFSAQLRVWDVFMLLGDSPPDLPDPATTSAKVPPAHCSSKGLEILHATSTAIINALREQLIDAEFENAMKALTSWVPIKDEELLMKVVRAEYKHHISKAKKT